jgi:flagellar hook-associated protein 1
MATIGHLFNIAKTGIQAHQQGLATTAHNIANINTKGYSRQEVVLESKRPAQGIVASGVEVGQIRRTVDTFLEKQLTTVTEELGTLSSRHHLLMRADGLFTETDQSGLSNTLTEFFNGVRDVSVNPESAVQRTVLLAKGQTLADQFVRVAQGLEQIRLDADGEIARHVETVNGLAIRIASLNDQIFKAEASGREAPDLRDQQAVLINEMAELIDLELVTLRDGIGVMVGGQLLVSGNHANSLTSTPEADNPPMRDVAFVRSDGNLLPVSANINGGKIGGLLQLRDTDMLELQERVDRLAAVLVVEFNRQHGSGFGLDGSINQEFFSPLLPDVPLAGGRNSGTASGTSVAIGDPTLLTFDNYSVQFTGATAYSVVNNSTGSTVTTGTYTSGGTISFDGLDVVITGPAAAGDVFSLSAHRGAAQRFTMTSLDSDQIAAAGSAGTVPGGNQNALALVGLHSLRHPVFGNVSFNDYHTITMGNTGALTRESELALQSKQLELNQIEQLRERVSGVSLDEELTNLLSYQRAFEASARLITVADDLLQTILGMGR